MTKEIAVLAPGKDAEPGLRRLIRDAAKQVDAEVATGRRPQPGEPDTLIDTLQVLFGPADLVVLDDTTEKPHELMLFALGVAQALGKPTVVTVDSDARLRYEQLAPAAVYRHDVLEDDDATRNALAGLFQQALDDPGAFRMQQQEKAKAATAFISYSHQDEPYLERLLVHLKPLQKGGVLDVWADTRLHGGNLWRSEIEGAMAAASIAVLLVSADFLASDFILDNELPPLLKKARRDGTVILPVVLSPCSFTRHPELSVFQAVNRAVPLGGLDKHGQETVWDEVAKEVARAIGRKSPEAASVPAAS